MTGQEYITELTSQSTKAEVELSYSSLASLAQDSVRRLLLA